MHEDLQSIVAADLAARRELEDVTQRLAARHETERARLQVARETARDAAGAALDAQVRAVDAEGQAAADARRAARTSCRARRRALAESVATSAIAAYVRILRTDDAGEGS